MRFECSGWSMSHLQPLKMYAANQLADVCADELHHKCLEEHSNAVAQGNRLQAPDHFQSHVVLHPMQSEDKSVAVAGACHT